MIFRRKTCILGLLLAGWLAVGCTSSPETESEDSVRIEGLDQATIDFPSTPQESFSFRIESNKTWSIAKSDLEWLAVSPLNGGSKLPATVTLTAQPNDDLAREGVLTLYAGAYSRSVSVRRLSPSFRKSPSRDSTTIPSNSTSRISIPSNSRFTRMLPGAPRCGTSIGCASPPIRSPANGSNR